MICLAVRSCIGATKRRPNHLRRRFAALVALLLHLLLVAAPLAHATEWEHGGEAHLHAPTDRDLSCIPRHDEVYCQVCRALGIRVLPPVEAAGTLPSSIDALLSVRPQGELPVLRCTGDAPLPRGPPAD